jgi:hypothetical protein
MTNASSNGEVYGSSALYVAMVVAAVVLLLGSIWSPATVSPAAAQISAPAPQVVVTAAAPTSHVS